MAEAVLEKAPGQLSEVQIKNHSKRLIADLHSTLLLLPETKDKYEQYELTKIPFTFERGGFLYEFSGDISAENPWVDLQKSHSDKPSEDITQIYIGYASESEGYALSFNKSKIDHNNQLEMDQDLSTTDNESTLTKIETFLKELKEGSPLTSS